MGNSTFHALRVNVRRAFQNGFLSAVYELPIGAGRRYLSALGVARKVLGGWSLSAIGSAQTGLPFNITVSTPAFGTFGDLGRSAFRAPAISSVDLALAKNVSFGERIQLHFRADAFNILNQVQYGAPNAVLDQSNFGIITTTISSYATGRGTPREFQLSAKISF